MGYEVLVFWLQKERSPCFPSLTASLFFRGEAVDLDTLQWSGYFPGQYFKMLLCRILLYYITPGWSLNISPSSILQNVCEVIRDQYNVYITSMPHRFTQDPEIKSDEVRHVMCVHEVKVCLGKAERVINRQNISGDHKGLPCRFLPSLPWFAII